MAHRKRPRRIITFIGNSDLRSAGISASKLPPRENDEGPIWRFVKHQFDKGEMETPGSLILLLDDKPDDGRRATYANWLGNKIASVPKSVAVDRILLELGNKPTNLNLLFRETFKQIPPEEDNHETHLLVSPGTPAMYATLVLAAEFLKMKGPRVFESSIEEGVVEIHLPYDIGLRPHQRSRRAPNTRGRPGTFLRELLPDTVLDDTGTRAIYEALYRSMQNSTRRGILLYGAAGSGKTHAARQVAHWLGCNNPTNVDALPLPRASDLGDCETVIVRNLQSTNSALDGWKGLMAALPQTQFVFLWRTDAADLDAGPDQAVQAGLAPGGSYRMPSLAEREDQITLVEAFARRANKWSGKVRERFQYTLMKHDAARNLHELETWVELAAAYSDGSHISGVAVDRATLQIEAAQAQGLLQKVTQVIADQSFIGRVPFEKLQQSSEELTLIVLGSGGDTLGVVASRLDIHPTTLNEPTRKAKRKHALQQVLAAWPEWQLK